MFVCVDPLLQKHLKVKVCTIICLMNLHELTYVYTFDELQSPLLI